METTLCPLCEANDFSIGRIETMTALTKGSTQQVPVITVVCNNCAHVFNNPRLSTSELGQFYSQYYREDFGDAEPADSLMELYNQDVDFITDQLGAGDGRRALEVGSYMGHTLNLLRSKGWEVLGIDPAKSVASICRTKFGIPVIESMFEEVEEPEEKFDLIVLGAVLEHINEPTHMLMKINKFLKASGYLFVRVPDVESLILDSVGDIFTFHHSNMYSSYALNLFFEKTGFKEVASTTHKGWPRHLIKLAEKTKSVHTPVSIRVDHDKSETLTRKLQEYDNYLNAERARVNEALEYLWSSGPKNIVIYGAGTHTEYLLKYTNICKTNIIALSDSNPYKWGKTIFGLRVIPPAEIDSLSPDAIVISSRSFQEDIYNTLTKITSANLIRIYDLSKGKIKG